MLNFPFCLSGFNLIYLAVHLILGVVNVVCQVHFCCEYGLLDGLMQNFLTVLSFLGHLLDTALDLFLHVLLRPLDLFLNNRRITFS